MMTEQSCVEGQYYVLTNLPQTFEGGNLVIGMKGKCRWKNYRGVCMSFPGGYSYVIPYDCLTPENSTQRKFRETPTAANCLTNLFRYRVANFDKMNLIPLSLVGRIGTLCQVCRVSVTGRCEVYFDDGDHATLSLNNLEDIGA